MSLTLSSSGLMPVVKFDASEALSDDLGPWTDIGVLRMCRVWEDVLGISDIRAGDDFFALGGDSLQALDVLAVVEQVFGKKLPLTALHTAPTCGQLAAMVRGGREPDLVPLVPLSRGGNGPPLFLLPGAGGSVFVFESLLKAASLGRPVYGVGLPTAGSDGDRVTTLEELARRCVAHVRKLEPEGPYLLAGHSFGGRLAFEMARQLQAAGHRIGFLGLFDTYGPGYPRPTPLARKLWRLLRIYRRLDPRERRPFLRERWRRLGRRVSSRANSLINPPWLQAAVVPEFIRDDFQYHRRLSLRYTPGIFPGRLTLFRACEVPEVFDFGDPYLGWGGRAAGGVDVRPVHGNHLTLFEEPHVRELARALKASLTP
jgi:aspartate racemase